MCACDHYREAAILNPRHYRALKLLGSALFGLGEYRAAQKCLEEALILRPDYADAHCDLGSALHAVHEDEQASIEFQRAIDLDPNHLDALNTNCIQEIQARTRSHLHSVGPRPYHTSFTARSSCLHKRGSSSSLGTNVTFIIPKLIDEVPSHAKEA
jgi:tetratricopeptide (TPR) repeat protein